jgi:hypothetical protein
VHAQPTYAKFSPVTDPAIQRPGYPANQGLPTGRLAAKANELGIGLRTLERWVSDYLKYGEAGLRRL